MVIKCLIIGVSTGGRRVEIKNIAKFVIGIDIAKPQLMKAKKKVNDRELILYDAGLLPFRN